MPFRAIGRVVSIHGSAITFLHACSAAELRPGETFAIAVDEHGQHQRVGWHEIERSDAEIGVCWTRIPVHAITPAACANDWIIAAARDQAWSPYP
jgi:hypothetical protein